jgi:hypothetical protein
MQRWLRFLLTFAILSAAAAVASGKDRDKPPKIVEYRDVPVQTSDFQDQKTPRDCTGSILLPGQVCWEVYPIAWQTFNGEKKGINLLINVWGDSASGVYFTWAALTISIDGRVIDLPEMDWNPGQYTFEGNTAVLKNDEALIRMIAAGNEVWLTAHATPRISIKLSPRTLRSMQAVIARYDSLVPAEQATSGSQGSGTQLQQVDAKIQPLATEYRSLNDQSLSLQKQCQAPITNRACMESARIIIVAGQKVDQSLVPLLNERISILNAMSPDASVLSEKNDTDQMLDKIKAELASLPEILQNLDQAMAEQKVTTAKP